MSDSKQRAKGVGMVRVVEATEQERVAMAQFLTNRTAPKGNDQKRHMRLYEHFALDAADEAHDAADQAAEQIAETKMRPKRPVNFSDFSPALVRYETTADVIDYFLEVTKEAVPGLWVNQIGRVKARMEAEPAAAAAAEESKA